MSNVAFFLLVVAGIFLIGTLGEVIFARTRIPDVVWLILFGLLLGPVLGVLHKDTLLGIAPYFAAFALVVILFNGGTSLKLDSVARAAPRALALALIGFAISVAAMAVASIGARGVGLLPDGWSWTHGIMLGCIVGGSSSIIIMPAMALVKLESRIADLVNLESAFTDALCVVGASACIAILTRGAGADGAPALVVAKSFGLAFAVGAAAGLLWLFLLYLLRDADHAYPITLAGLLLLYVLIERLGASAAMGILTFAVLVGNARLIGHRVGMATDIDLGLGVRGFHSQMSFIVKSFFFVLIGALLTPPWPLLLLGVALGALLLLVRMPAVRLATLGAALERPQRALVTVALPRGLAAGVLATMPMAAGVPATDVLPVVVFATIVTTIAIFTVGLPMSARRLDAAAAPADRLEPPPAPDPATAASRSGAPE